jgi:hypothetical protein
MGHGRAEEGHDPVAHHLVDGALVVMDSLHHSFGPIEQRPQGPPAMRVKPDIVLEQTARAESDGRHTGLVSWIMAVYPASWRPFLSWSPCGL